MIHKRIWSLLIIILLLTLAFRLYFSLQSEHFSSDEAYFHLRHVSYILENGKPMLYDELSYNGRPSPYPPLYNYLLALFSLFMPITLSLKIIPALLAVLLPLIVFFISYELSKNTTASLFSSFFSAFIPANVDKMLNTASIYSIALPMFFFAIYCLIKLREERTYLVYFVILAVLFPLTHPSSFLMLSSLIVYSLIMVSENLKIRTTIKESITFAALSILFIQFTIFKKAFLDNGISILWQNTPPIIFATAIEQLSFTQITYGLGILPLILGAIAILMIVMFNRKDSHILMVSIVITILAAAIFKMISISEANLFLSVTLAILSSITLTRLFNYIDITKIANKKNYFIYTMVVLTIILSFIPSIIAAQSSLKKVPADIDIEALQWIKNNIEQPIIIAALPDEGNLVAYTSGKSNVMDDYYILAPDSATRLQDLNDLYLTDSEFKALDITQKYNIDFIFVSEKVKSRYNIDDLLYASTKRCFDRRKYEDFGKIYQVRKC